MTVERQKHDPELKRKAVAMAFEPGIQQARVARNPGIEPKSLSPRVQESKLHGSKAFAGNGIVILSDEQKRNREPEAKLKDTEIERDILKKQGPFLAKHRNEILIFQQVLFN